jgi:sugar/nucleoside kinase (ribokinase family)
LSQKPVTVFVSVLEYLIVCVWLQAPEQGAASLPHADVLFWSSAEMATLGANFHAWALEWELAALEATVSVLASELGASLSSATVLDEAREAPSATSASCVLSTGAGDEAPSLQPAEASNARTSDVE